MADERDDPVPTEDPRQTNVSDQKVVIMSFAFCQSSET